VFAPVRRRRTPLCSFSLFFWASCCEWPDIALSLVGGGIMRGGEIFWGAIANGCNDMMAEWQSILLG
jgi:hypothetical protein